MTAHGGFEHNLQSLRVVDELEERYPRFDGLNLSFETREGILKHCSRANAQRIEAAEPGGVARRFLDRTPAEPGGAAVQPGRRDRLQRPRHRRRRALRPDHARTAWPRSSCSSSSAHETLARASRNCRAAALLYEAIRRMLSAQVYDVIDSTRAAVEGARRPARMPSRARPRRWLRFSDAMRAQSAALKRFLLHNLYRHPQVMATTGQAKQVVRELFDAYLGRPSADAAGLRQRDPIRRARWPTTSPA